MSVEALSVKKAALPAFESHGPLAGQPVFFGADEVITTIVRKESDGTSWVDVYTERPDEPQKFDITAVRAEDWEDFLKQENHLVT